MILLVVGLVAVIVVVLIAVFLSIRLGRGDEPDRRGDERRCSGTCSRRSVGGLSLSRGYLSGIRSRAR